VYRQNDKKKKKKKKKRVAVTGAPTWRWQGVGNSVNTCWGPKVSHRKSNVHSQLTGNPLPIPKCKLSG